MKAREAAAREAARKETDSPVSVTEHLTLRETGGAQLAEK